MAFGVPAFLHPTSQDTPPKPASTCGKGCHATIGTLLRCASSLGYNETIRTVCASEIPHVANKNCLALRLPTRMRKNVQLRKRLNRLTVTFHENNEILFPDDSTGVCENNS